MHDKEAIGMAAGLMVILTLIDKVGIDLEEILAPEVEKKRSA